MPDHAAPRSFLFADDGAVPNNPALPFMVYPGGIDLAEEPDPAAAIERVFARNGWGNSWRNGIFRFVHYHSMIHECLGIARGQATVRFGGAQGRDFALAPGDVAVLPAGTGHQCLRASADLVVVGAYPPEGTYDLCRGGEAEHANALSSIPAVPLPRTDPVHGRAGPLLRLWNRRRAP